MASNPPSQKAKLLGPLLLVWYDNNKRQLPWRSDSQQNINPYHVWLSEVMLQQTIVTTVKPYFNLFLEKWPTINDLANADLDSVLHAWQGLGYYARARNLHKCAKYVTSYWNGKFPQSEKELLTLPGVGVYTAAAIIAIAYNQPSAPIDGNIRRVMSRVLLIDTLLPESTEVMKKFLLKTLVNDRVGDFVQAMMDLGATICKPKNPRCNLCPWKLKCDAFNLSLWEQYPSKVEKKPKKTRFGVVFWLVRGDGAVLIRRRKEKGLLGGMAELPSTDWRENEWTRREVSKLGPIDLEWRELEGIVTHTFSHFYLQLRLVHGIVGENSFLSGVWVNPKNFDDYAFPSVIKKVLDLGKSQS